MPAKDTHPDYDKYLPRWNTVCDCVEGSDAIKAKKTAYLPMPNPEDTSEENIARYKDYVNRANFVSFTGFTLEGMLGMVFKKEVVTAFQSAIEYLEYNVNGGGLTLDQLSRDVISEVLQKGRYGLLVDYPSVDGGLSAAQVQEMQLRANILPYAADNIRNWQTTVINGVTVLSLVALAEIHKEYSDDGFSYEPKEYTRVLKLDESGYYVQQVYNDKDEIIDTIEPKQANGARWKEIPFAFVGSKNNDSTVDKSPLYDIAQVNIGHYRNSADFEESSYMVGQPTPVLTGLTQTWVEKVMDGGVMLGSRRAILLPEGGSGSLMQSGENVMPERGMAAKEEQMKKIGSRIIEDSKGNETAEAAKIRFGGQNSKLGTVVGNTESAFKQCFEWVMLFMGISGENDIEINKNFYDKSADPQLIMARIQMFDRGIIAKQDFRDKLRQEGEIDDDRKDEEIDNDADDITGFN